MSLGQNENKTEFHFHSSLANNYTNGEKISTYLISIISIHSYICIGEIYWHQ